MPVAQSSRLAKRLVGNNSQGFTLLEVLMVVLLVGIISGIALLGFNPGGSERQIRQESERLASLIEQISDEAVMQNREFGLLLTAEGYQFLCLDEKVKKWVICEDKNYQPHQLPEGVKLRLLHGTDSSFSLEISDESNSKEDKKNQIRPDVLFLSSGESSPVSLEFATQPESEQHQIMTIDELGRVSLDNDGADKEEADKKVPEQDDSAHE